MGIGTAFLLHLPASLGHPSAEMMQNGARCDWGWLAHGREVMPGGGFIGTPDFSYYTALGNEFRALSPGIKIGIGGESWGHNIQWSPSILWLTDADMLHTPGGAPLDWVQEGIIHHRGINIGSPAARARMIAGFIDFCQDHDFDGVTIDGFSPAYYARNVREPPPPTGTGFWNCPTGCLEGPAHTEAWWVTNLEIYGQEMKAAFEAVGLVSFAVGIAPVEVIPTDPTSVWFGQNYQNIVPWHSFMHFEGPVASYGSPEAVPGILDTLKDCTDNGGKVFPSTSTALYTGPLGFYPPYLGEPPTSRHNLANTDANQKYFLAQYLLSAEAGKTYHSYHPYDPYRGWTIDTQTPFIGYYDDWDLPYGAPLGSYQQANGPDGPVWVREYEHCYVALNAALSARRAPVPSGRRWRVWDPEMGQIVDSTGTFLLPLPAATEGGGRVFWPILEDATVARAQLRHTVIDAQGDAVPSTPVTVLEPDGVSPIAQTMYTAATGGSVVTAPATNSLGLVELYVENGQRCVLSIDGSADLVHTAFYQDPEELVLLAATALDYVVPAPITPVPAGQPIASGVPHTLVPNRPFAITDPDSVFILELTAGAIILSATVNTQYAMYLVLDDTVTYPCLTSVQQTASVITSISGGVTHRIEGLSVGTHQVKVLLTSSGGPATLHLRAPNVYEFLRIKGSELRRG